MTLLSQTFRKAVEIVLPAHCVGCNARGSYLCDRCVAGMVPADPLTVRPDDVAFDTATAPFEYQGVARAAVHHLKFRNLRAIAPIMGGLIVDAVPPDLTLDAVVPVPLHRSRLRERGYNQSELIASRIAKALAVPLTPTLLARTSQHGTQVEAPDAHARRANVASAFAASAAAAGLRIALVDDVTTTGSTLDAAAKVLIRAGAMEVHCFTFARER